MPGSISGCVEALGWIGFDPTSALIVAGGQIVLAVGRDHADGGPMGGVVLGPGDQTIQVAVDVAPDNEIQTLDNETWPWRDHARDLQGVPRGARHWPRPARRRAR